MQACKPTIIPIASGKGGVGKSFFTANIAMALADMGHETVAVDLDLGGSNLHSLFGLPNRFPGIGDFLKANGKELEDLVVSLPEANLKFLPGDGRTPFLANIPYAQKQKLISGIKRLPADYILLDLGAGTSFNTLDFFRLSSRGIVITTLEYPSILSMLAFLKNSLLRVIERTFAGDERILEMLAILYKQSVTEPQTTMDAVRNRIASVDNEAGEKMSELCKQYRPRIIFNMGEDPEELKAAEQINNILKSILSIEADYFGFIFEDPIVRKSVKRRVAFYTNYRDDVPAKCLKNIAERIMKFWDRSIQNSNHLLLQSTKKFYECHGMPN